MAKTTSKHAPLYLMISCPKQLHLSQYWENIWQQQNQAEHRYSLGTWQFTSFPIFFLLISSKTHGNIMILHIIL